MIAAFACIGLLFLAYFSYGECDAAYRLFEPGTGICAPDPIVTPHELAAIYLGGAVAAAFAIRLLLRKPT